MAEGNILIIDDDAFFRKVCSDILSDGDYAIKTASTGLAAMDIIASEHIDIVITDLFMPDIDGLEVLERTKQINASVDVIVVTGHGSIDTAVKALKNGAFDYLMKPIHEEELRLTVRNCIEKKRLLEENQEMRSSLKLYDISKAITATLDIHRLYSSSLDALLQLIPSGAGMTVFLKDSVKDPEIKSIRHLTLASGEKVAKALKEDTSMLDGIRDVLITGKADFLNCGGIAELNEFSSVLVIPALTRSDVRCVIVLFSPQMKGSFSKKDLKNLSFITENIVMAFENAHKFDEAKELAFIDSLTNLYNSKYLETALEREIKRSERLMLPMSILFLDVDNFKKINDTNDHLIGSKVLVEIGKVLLKCVREIDTVIRYGGDEYVIILVDADYNSGLKVAERIRSAIENHCFLEKETCGIKTTASIGVATFPSHAKDKTELLKIADKAMYHAKDISRNVVYLAPVPDKEARMEKAT